MKNGIRKLQYFFLESRSHRDPFGKKKIMKINFQRYERLGALRNDLSRNVLLPGAKGSLVVVK